MHNRAIGTSPASAGPDNGPAGRSGWEEPKESIAERFGLRTDCGPGSSECCPVCLQSEHCDTAWLQYLHLGLQLHGGLAQLGGTGPRLRRP